MVCCGKKKDVFTEILVPAISQELFAKQVNMLINYDSPFFLSSSSLLVSLCLLLKTFMGFTVVDAPSCTLWAVCLQIILLGQ